MILTPKTFRARMETIKLISVLFAIRCLFFDNATELMQPKVSQIYSLIIEKKIELIFFWKIPSTKQPM